MNWDKICKKCGGKCCIDGGGTSASKREVKKIERELGRKVETIQNGKLYHFVNHKNNDCVFNPERKGCILKYKPICCEIGPFMPTMSGWMLRTWCPFWYTFTRKDLEVVKKEFEPRKEDWVSPYDNTLI